MNRCWAALRGARQRQPGQHALNLLVPVAPLVRPRSLFIGQFQSERPESVSGPHIVLVERVVQATALVQPWPGMARRHGLPGQGKEIVGTALDLVQVPKD